MGGLSHTVSGDIASFRTPSRVPIESLKFHFLPKQEGSGDPSPTNIRPITGWTGLTWQRSKKNLLNPFTNPIWLGSTKYTINNDGSVTVSGSDGRSLVSDQITPVSLPKGTYTFTWTGSPRVQFATSNDSYAQSTTYTYSVTGGRITFTLNADGGIKWKHTTDNGNYPVTCFVQIEQGSSPHTYEGYSGSVIPVTFPDGQTIYGGYYDPIIGKIKSEWSIYVFDGTENDLKMNYRPASGTGRVYTLFTGADIAHQDIGGNIISNMLKTTPQKHGSNIIFVRPSSIGCFMDFDRTTICNLTIEEFDALTNAEQVQLVKTYLAELYANGTPLIIAFKASLPSEYNITPQDLQAFLDYNNFWSDTNDITEVTYPVTESKDILATRKKAMNFDHAHHKKVKWNQLQVDGNFQDVSKWEGFTNYTNVSASNGIITATCITKPTQYYHTGFRTKNSVGSLAIPYNHKVLVTAYLRSSEESRVRIYGLVGSNGNTYKYGYNYANANMPSNEWVRLIGFIPNRPETPPAGLDDTIIKRFKPLILGKNGDMSTIPNGATIECKLLMAFDLTQMFGLGNEPQTVAEFEHICEINGIDLTTYQPYDAGSDRWLIVP